MDGNGKLLTIPEAAELFCLSETTLYKRVKRGQLSYNEVQVKGRIVKKVQQSDLIGIYGEPDREVQVNRLEETGSSTGTDWNKLEVPLEETGRLSEDITHETTIEYDKISDIVKENIKKVIEEKQNQLMKPLEDQALYLAGKYEAENKFLKERLETVLLENEELRLGLKALPGPPGEVLNILEDLKSKNKTLQTEQEKLQEAHKINNMELLELQENQSLKEQEIEKLKESIKAQVEETRNQEQIIQEQKEHFQKEEKDYFATIEELKKQLEEEQNKPWWKKLW